MIEASHLAKRFGSVKAVDDLSFRIEPGEIVGLLGRNGAGKTTTLHMLAGITRPDVGDIRVCGVDLLQRPKSAKACLGFVADEPEFFEYLTVEEHLKFSGMLYGIRDGAAAADRLISRFDLEEKRRAFPEELSRGMRQKLALACVLHHEPEALLLDEPLTGLDPAGMRDMKDTILARARDGAAILLSSHLLFLVEELCSRLLIVHDGKLVASGTMQEIRGQAGGGTSRELEAAFLEITSRPAGSVG
jgi:ABC-2 type transport system ATP-binding protein